MADTLPLMRSSNRVAGINFDINDYPRLSKSYMDDIGWRLFNCIDGTVQADNYRFYSIGGTGYVGWPAMYEGRLVFVAFFSNKDELYDMKTGELISTLPVIDRKHYHE